MFLVEMRDGRRQKADLCCVDIFEDDVGAGDVDHVQAATDDQTPFMEVVSVSLFECCLESRVLRYKLSSSPPS